MATRQATPDILGEIFSDKPASGPQARSLRIAEIRRDGGTQPRSGLDEAHVQDLVAAIENGAELPPVDVTFDGTNYWLFDGYHRTEAVSRRGLYTVMAVIHQGTQADAQWASYSANAAHGLKRSNEDKKRQVMAALRHQNGASMSNMQIARHVGVDESTVRVYRSQLESASGIPKVAERTGADGKVYNTANIGSNQPRRTSAPTTAPQPEPSTDAWRPPGFGTRLPTVTPTDNHAYAVAAGLVPADAHRPEAAPVVTLDELPVVATVTGAVVDTKRLDRLYHLHHIYQAAVNGLPDVLELMPEASGVVRMVDAALRTMVARLGRELTNE